MENFEEELREAEKEYKRSNFKSAYKKYLALAEKNHKASQVFLGWMISNGIGTNADPKTAAIWFERAALLGSTQGEFYYGRYLTQNGKHEDALKWYLLAAKKGDLPSVFRLGYSHVKGKGTPINILQGYKYLLSAMACGHIFALREVAILDLKGNRGFLRRIIGFWLLIYAICLGIGVSYYQPIFRKVAGITKKSRGQIIIPS